MIDKQTVKPKDLDLTTLFDSLPELRGVELSTEEIVIQSIIGLCKEAGDWIPFSKIDYYNFRKCSLNGELCILNMLFRAGYLEYEQEKYSVTDVFVEKIYKAS